MMTQPTYDPNIPANRPDSLKTTQPQLQSNFQTLFDAFAVNHVSLTSSNQTPGNHLVIDLIQQLNAIETNVNEINIYTKENEDTTTQVFFRYQGNGQEFEFTNYQIYSIKPKTVSSKVHTPFFTLLPGNVLLYFGSIVNNSIKQESTMRLDLLPPIAKHIITTTVCIHGSGPSQFPSVSLPPTEDEEFIKYLTFNNSNAVFFPSIDYLVMANI